MGWPSKAAASLFFGAATESGLAPRLETVPISAHQPTKRTTQSRNVVCLRRRIATQHLKYAAAPNSRTMMPPWRRMSFVVITPEIDIGEGPRRSADMWSCDLHASDLPLALVDRAAGMEDRPQRDHALPLGE